MWPRTTHLKMAPSARARLVAAFALACVSSSFLAACSDRAGPSDARVCGLLVWHAPARKNATVAVRGSWDGFRQAVPILRQRDDGWRAVRLDVPPGPVKYEVLEDGRVLAPDPRVGTTAFHEGREVNLAFVDDCAAPLLEVQNVEAVREATPETVTARFTLSVTRARDPKPVAPADVSVRRARDGAAVEAQVDADASGDTLYVLVRGLRAGKHTLITSARDARGVAAPEVRMTAWVEPSAPRPSDDARPPAPLAINARTPADWLVYHLLLDRYRDADGRALTTPREPTARAGGKLSGLRLAIERGELSALGMNAVWLSPLYRGPEGSFADISGRQATNYHGYWPIAAREVEPALGSEADVDALVEAAHARGLRVMLDVVPNHVFRDHPYARKLRDGWFNHPDGDCVCGSATCPWWNAIESCWFTPLLPDLDWRSDEVAAAATEDILYWLTRFDLDGLRIDAVPMMPRAAVRRIAAAVRARLDHPTHRTYLLGENFVGPDDFDALRYYLGPFGLDGQFDFPLLWTLRGVLGEGRGALGEVATVLERGDATWRGSGATMGVTLGNHDVARFATVASGDAQGSSFDPAPEVTDPRVFAKQALALAIVFSVPGAPILYYGDEVALAGRGDPDNRRVLPDTATLPARARALREVTAALAKLRACSPALRRGGYRTLSASDEHLVFLREDGAGSDEDRVVVALQRAWLPNALPRLSALLGETRHAALRMALRIDYDPDFGARLGAGSDATAELSPAVLSAQVFVPRGSYYAGCLR